jgi:uncharacterized protein (DUF433 family)
MAKQPAAKKSDEVPQNQRPTRVPKLHITRTRGVCGGKPVVAGTRVTVRALVEARRIGTSDQELLEDFPFLTQNDLKAVWAYAALHPQEFEHLIRHPRGSTNGRAPGR